MKEYFVIEGGKPGPISVIMAGVHGNEPCGVKAVDKILSILKQKIIKGKVIFLLGNPLALKEEKRFVDANLNRMFKSIPKYDEKFSYEYHRAKFLMSVLDQADALLDLHSTRNPSKPYAFVERLNQGNKLVLSNLPVEISKVVFAANDFHPGCSEGYMYQNGKIGICVECGQHEDPSSVRVAETSILTFLNSRGHFIGEPKLKDYAREFFCFSEIYFTKVNFTPKKVFPDFTYVKKGTIIGIDGNEKVKAQKNSYVLFVVAHNEPNKEAFVLADRVY